MESETNESGDVVGAKDPEVGDEVVVLDHPDVSSDIYWLIGKVEKKETREVDTPIVSSSGLPEARVVPEFEVVLTVRTGFSTHLLKPKHVVLKPDGYVVPKPSERSGFSEVGGGRTGANKPSHAEILKQHGFGGGVLPNQRGLSGFADGK